MPKPGKHREAIVEAAVRLFREHGYAATGIGEIAAESGAPKGSIYHFFPGGKPEIGAAAITAAGKFVSLTLRRLATESATPSELVRRYGAMLAGWMTESGFAAGCPIATTLLEEAPRDAAITDAGRNSFAVWRSILASELAAQGLGAERAGRLAGLTIAAMEGALIEARVTRSPAPILDAADELAHLIDVLNTSVPSPERGPLHGC